MGDAKYKKNDPRLIGNQFAKGCTNGGRPRTATPEPEECEALGKEMLAWFQVEDKEKPRSTFAQWYSLEKGIIRKVWKTIVQSPEFLPYYEQVQVILSERAKNPQVMDKSFGHRYLRLFDRDLIESENEQARFEAELKRLDPEQAKELLIQITNYATNVKKMPKKD